MAAQPGRKRKSNCLGTDEVGALDTWVVSLL